MLNICFSLTTSWCNSYFLCVCFSNWHFFSTASICRSSFSFCSRLIICCSMVSPDVASSLELALGCTGAVQSSILIVSLQARYLSLLQETREER